MVPGSPDDVLTLGPGRLIVARHGRTVWNAAGRFQGQSDPPLDDIGRAQAEVLADRLVAALAGVPTVEVVSSDLARARQTAEAVAARFGVDVRTDPRLREVALGGWEGLDHRQVAARFPGQYVAWRAGEPVRRGGGESDDDAGRRALPVLADAAGSAVPGHATVIVAHGVVLQAALRCWGWAGAPHLGNGEFVEPGFTTRAR